MTLNGITISTIRSGKGDCIHLNYDSHNLIVDSGPTSTVREFRSMCELILATGQTLDALVITHYDDDHIGGILKTGDIGFREIYFNAYDGVSYVKNSNLSARQNQRLFHMLPETVVHSRVLDGDEIHIGGARIIIHGPSLSDLSDARKQMREVDTQLGVISDWGFTFDELMERDCPSADASVSNRASIVFTFEYEEQCQ